MIWYLDRTQFATRIGVKPESLSHYKLPPPDAMIGDGPRARRGWLAVTVDAWNASRPGRGWRAPTGETLSVDTRRP